MWNYKSKAVNSLDDIPENTYGFIYEILHKPTGKRYIGKKALFFERNIKLGKKETQQLIEERKDAKIRGRLPGKKKVTKESDWKVYYGSQEEIKKLVREGTPEDFEREILQFVSSKKLLTYYEVKWQFIKEVLEIGSNYINDNIEGRYFRKDFLTKE